MLELLPESRADILVLRASEKLTALDYEEEFIPLLEKLIRQYGHARVLLYLDEDFQGWEAEALWDDAAFGLRHRSDFEKIAVVGAPAWLEWGIRIGNTLLEGEARTFGPDDLSEALAWVSDFPDLRHGDGLEFEFDEEALILTVRPRGRLRKEDFVRIKHRIDPIIDDKGMLNGLLIVAETFPWWEDFAAMITHLEFVHDHHRKIRKVALVTRDSTFRFLSGLAGHFVQAEIRQFDGEAAARRWLKGE
jgi:hypothetical protein